MSNTGLTATKIRRLEELLTGSSGGLDWSRSHLGYDYIAEFLSQSGNVDQRIATWFEKAGEINRNDPLSAANAFIRSVTEFGRELDGGSKLSVQEISNLIGEEVLGGIISTGTIPIFEDMVRDDVGIAIRRGGQTHGGWGGAFNYWNTESENGRTIGDIVLADPAEYEKFVAVNAAAVDAVWGQEWGAAVHRFELADIISFSYGAEIPGYVKDDIIERAFRVGTGEAYLGDPNRIELPGPGNILYQYRRAFQDWVGVTSQIQPTIASGADLDYLNAARAYRLEKGPLSVFHPANEDRGNILENLGSWLFGGGQASTAAPSLGSPSEPVRGSSGYVPSAGQVARLWARAVGLR